MNIWKIYAILNSGVIEDVIAYPFDDTGVIKSKVEAVRRYGDNGDSFEITNYHACIGDTVSNGKVYRDGVEIPAVPTQAEEIANLNETVDDILIEILGG